MEITRVKIQTAAANGDFRGYAHITFDNCIRVIGLRLFHTENGYELFMPSKKLSSGQRVILAEPKTDEMKNRIKAALIAEYERVTGEHNVQHQ
jgi:stage V sporulation protein G